MLIKAYSEALDSSVGTKTFRTAATQAVCEGITETDGRFYAQNAPADKLMVVA